MERITILLIVFVSTLFQPCSAETKIIWQIGENDNSSGEFALAPDGFKKFLEKDFGWEDRYYLIGKSDHKTDWPYVIPGPADQWGGTWGTSGWRSHTLNILFGVKKLPNLGDWKLVVDIKDCNSKKLPLFKVTINGKSWKYEIPEISDINSLEGESADPSEYLIEIAIPEGVIKKGGNEINLTTIQGSWLLFDHITLEGPGSVTLTEDNKVFLRGVEAVGYEIDTENGREQPLLVDVEHIAGNPHLKVVLDGKEIFSETVETGRYTFEAPMPAVSSAKKSEYEIWVDGTKIESGKVTRKPQQITTPADYVETKIGSAHSRWMIAPGPWMPFSMVKLSPDNQNKGWQSGYDPIFESIGGFSHIHEWTMAGLLTMPTNGTLQTEVGDQKHPDSGYRSRINKETEEAPLG
jgi:hypothetical protein